MSGAWIVLAIPGAWAMPTIAVPLSSADHLQMRVKETTQVRHSSFAIDVPPNWTFVAGRRSEAGSGDGAWILLTPADDVKNAPIRLSLKNLGSATSSIEQMHSRWASDSGLWVRYVFWRSHRWLLAEAERGSVHRWAAYTTDGGTAYWMAATAPKGQAAQSRPVLFKTMESMTLLPR